MIESERKIRCRELKGLGLGKMRQDLEENHVDLRVDFI